MRNASINDLAKFLTFLLEGAKAIMITIIKPINGRQKRRSYPRYPKGEIGLYSSGI
jgi:hypothetical protein